MCFIFNFLFSNGSRLNKSIVMVLAITSKVIRVILSWMLRGIILNSLYSFLLRGFYTFNLSVYDAACSSLLLLVTIIDDPHLLLLIQDIYIFLLEWSGGAIDSDSTSIIIKCSWSSKEPEYFVWAVDISTHVQNNIPTRMMCKESVWMAESLNK